MNFLNKMKDALKKTSSSISLAITGKKVDESFLAKLEDALILADVGVKTAQRLTSEIARQKFSKDVTENEIREILSHNIENMLKPYEKALLQDLHKPEVVLVIGVNGNGKTTTVAKLANLLKRKGNKVLLVAADTFRVAAVAQLEYWSNKIGVDICKEEEGSDPASLVYKSLEKAKAEGFNVVLIDTAGRMQNRSDLIGELKKIKRVIKKIDSSAPHTTILTIDGLTGQASHKQVDVFKNEIGIDSLIMTKLDATAKGGAIISLTQEYNVPISYIGVGEGVDDIQNFDARQYARGITGMENGL